MERSYSCVHHNVVQAGMYGMMIYVLTVFFLGKSTRSVTQKYLISIGGSITQGRHDLPRKVLWMYKVDVLLQEVINTSFKGRPDTIFHQIHKASENVRPQDVEGESQLMHDLCTENIFRWVNTNGYKAVCFPSSCFALNSWSMPILNLPLDKQSQL